MKDKIKVINGDCTKVMKDLEAEIFDSCVCDPPYHLASIVKRFGKEKTAKKEKSNMHGKDKQPPNRGAQYKRLSRGFMGKEWDGGDVAFNPETWRLVFDLLKPGAHLCAFAATRNYHRMAVAIEDAGFEIRDQLAWIYGTGFPKSHDVKKDLEKHGVDGAPWQGRGTALKPAWEPIVLARKPLQGTVAMNVMKHGTGAINIDACRIGESGGTKDFPTGVGNKKNEVFGKYGAAETKEIDGLGRFPANILHDGSREVLDYFPTGAGKFFYSAKADKAEKIDREDSHPTVKPVDLMSWLCRLVTPPGGRILDPFGGTGSTGIGGALEGFNVTLIERDPGYYKDILTRIERTTGDDLPMFSGVPQQLTII